MSTTYGFKCTKCGKQVLGDQLPHYAAQDIMKNLTALSKLYTIMESIVDLDLAIQTYVCYNFSEILEFIHKHYDHGIELIDEYEYCDVYKETD